MYLIHRADIDEYKTVHKEDAELFHEIINNNLFDKEDENGNITRYPNRLELITDKTEIKKVLDEKFSSRNRTEEYEAGLPSATVIASSLFPLNIDYKDRGSKFNILRWWNNISLADMNAQKITNKISTDSGNFIHRTIELCMLSGDRIYDKKRNLLKYIDIASKDDSIISSISNFENREKYFIDMAKNVLSKFFQNEIEHIHPIFPELFINLPNKIQGAIDLLAIYKGKLCIMDWKTSKKSMSRSQVEDKRYLAQLYIYSRMLLLSGIITKKEYDNLEFHIGFFNWSSGNSALYTFTKEEVDKSKAYVNFVYNFYHQNMFNREDLIFEL